MRAIAALLACLCAAPAAAQDWFVFDEGVATSFAGGWTGTCQMEPPYGCAAVAHVAATPDAAPGRISLSWALWGDEGYGFQFFAVAAPDSISGNVTITIDSKPLILKEQDDYFPLTGEYGPLVRAIEIGEPIVVETLVQAMLTGKTLAWDWGTGQLTLPLAGFAETYEAVEDYREELDE